MIFVDYLGPAEDFEGARRVIAREVAAQLRMPEGQVVVRRLVTEGGTAHLELWVELSSDEQLYRLGGPLAKRLSSALRAAGADGDVWVMYRVVPLSHAFRNGDPRARGTASLE